MRFVIYAQIKKLFEVKDQGWFVLFDGSHESLFLGAEKPPLAISDCVRITIEKVEFKPDANA